MDGPLFSVIQLKYGRYGPYMSFIAENDGLRGPNVCFIPQNNELCGPYSILSPDSDPQVSRVVRPVGKPPGRIEEKYVLFRGLKLS